MSKLHLALEGAGNLVLRGGEVLPGQYQIAVRFFPVRQAFEVDGCFELGAEAPYESVIDAAFAGTASIRTEEGQSINVILGGIEALTIPLTSMDPQLFTKTQRSFLD